MSRRRRVLVVIAIVVGLLVVAANPIVTVIGFGAQHNELVRGNNAARVASCWQSRHQTFTVRAGERQEIRFVISALIASARHRPSPQALATFYAGYDRVVRETNPLRDCSPAGIAAFLHLPDPGGSK